VLHIIGMHDQLDKNELAVGCHTIGSPVFSIWMKRISATCLPISAGGDMSRQRLTRRTRGVGFSGWSTMNRTERGIEIVGPKPKKIVGPQPKHRGQIVGKKTADTWEIRAKKDGGQNDPSSLKSLSENDRTYVQHREHIKEELVGGTDCAEARRQGEVREAEKYLSEIETVAASPDRDQLKFERRRIEQLASDACLPEALNERAARLLHQIDRQ
jgi:hypothetical protein